MQRTLGALIQIAGAVIFILSLTVWFFFDHQELGIIPAAVPSMGLSGQVLNFLLACIIAGVGGALFIFGRNFRKRSL